MHEHSHQHTLREYPTRSAIFGLISLLLGLYLYSKNGQWIPLAVFFGITLACFLFSSILTVRADRLTAVLSISRRGLLRHYQRKINFHEIKSIQLGTSFSNDNGVSRSYRVEIQIHDGDVVPLRPAYSSGHKKKAETAESLRDFIGVSGAPIAEEGMADLMAQIMQSQPSLPQGRPKRRNQK